MKSKWYVSSQYMDDGVKQYIAMRTLDTSKPQHGGNVETAGIYSSDREAVQKFADELNEGV